MSGTWPEHPMPASQAWFWNEWWQQREREVDDAVTGGEATTFDAAADLVAHLRSLPEE